MALTTLFGTAQLAAQQALADGVTIVGGTAEVPNLIIVSLRRDRFAAERQGVSRGEIERFRRELHQTLKEYADANGWRFGGFGAPVVNVLLRSIARDCEVAVRSAASLYDLIVVDGGGQRRVHVRSNPLVIGRRHDGLPRAFVALDDPDRLVSRRHLELTYADLAVTVRLLGRNPTTINGQDIGEEEMGLNVGDVLACGRCRIMLAALG